MFDDSWKIYAFGFAAFSHLFVCYVHKLKAGEFARRDPSRSALVRLYWQRPMASVQANKVLYWFCMVPFLCFCLLLAVPLFIIPDPSKPLTAEIVIIYLYAFGAINLIRGPDGFVATPAGLFWLTFYPWEAIAKRNWKRDKNGEYFCFTLPPKNDEYPQETKMGPISIEDRERIEAVLQLIPEPENVESESESPRRIYGAG